VAEGHGRRPAADPGSAPDVSRRSGPPRGRLGGPPQRGGIRGPWQQGRHSGAVATGAAFGGRGNGAAFAGCGNGAGFVRDPIGTSAQRAENLHSSKIRRSREPVSRSCMTWMHGSAITPQGAQIRLQCRPTAGRRTPSRGPGPEAQPDQTDADQPARRPGRRPPTNAPQRIVALTGGESDRWRSRPAATDRLSAVALTGGDLGRQRPTRLSACGADRRRSPPTAGRCLAGD